jgi:anti-sigma factor RsiW
MSQDIEEDLSAWLDGELSDARAKEIAAAVAADPRLGKLADSLKKSREALTALSTPELSPRLRALVLSEVAKQPEKRPFWPALFLGFAAAAGLAALVWWPREPALDEERMMLAQNLELLEDYDTMTLSTPEDLEVIAAMKELEATP